MAGNCLSLYRFEAPEVIERSVLMSEVRNWAALSPTLPEDLQRAVPTRQREFILGRHCAEQALTTLGARTLYIGVAADRRPVWPEAFVGSITHTTELAAAAVARRSVASAIGIDSEKEFTEPTLSEIGNFCFSDAELALASEQGQLGTLKGATLLYSAKEALFKCLYPLTRTYFDFHDAQVVHVDPHTSLLTVRLRRRLNDDFPDGAGVTGSWNFAFNHAHVAFLVRA